MVVSTRARAADSTPAETRSTRITTPAAKARRNTKRKATEEDQDLADETSQGKNLEASKATRGRPKRTAANKSAKDEEMTTPMETAGTPAPKPTRGRPRKATTTNNENINPTEEPKRSTTKRGKLSEEPKKHATRASKPTESSQKTFTKTSESTGGSAISRVDHPRIFPSAIKGASGALAAAPKKKVTFQTEPISTGDKENQAPQPPRGKQIATIAEAENPSTAKAKGLRAKPMRRPAAKATRGSNKKQETSAENSSSTKESVAVSPLSPKKAKQIAVAKPTTSDKDERAKNETPVKELAKSPVKAPGSTVPSSIKKDIYSLEAPSAQQKSLPVLTKENSLPVLNSPARRPPASPYKDALKGTPMKFTLEQPVSKTFFKAATPKPAKASLLQSPARRPSPAKAIPASAPARRHGTCPVTDPTQTITAMKFTNRSMYTPSRLGRSPLGPARSPVRSPVHSKESEKLPLEEKQVLEIPKDTPAGAEIDEVESPDAVMDDSPSKSTFQDELLQTPSRLSTVIELPSMIDLADTPVPVSHKGEESRSKVKRSTTPPGPPPRTVPANFGSLTPVTNYPSDDSESEDELQSHRRGYSPKHKIDASATPTVRAPGSPFPFNFAKTPRSTARKGERRSQNSSLRPSQLSAITPLTDKLNNWKGASPGKKVTSQREQRGHEIFSVPVFGKPGTGLKETTSSPLVPSPSTMNLTPMQQSFFSDEMNVREQEDFLMMDAEEREDGLNADLHLSIPSNTPARFSDEQMVPIDPALLDKNGAEPAPGENDMTITCTPARLVAETPRVVHTVTKVPLKPAADDESPSRLPLRPSPIKLRRSPRKSLQKPVMANDDTLKPKKTTECNNFAYETPTKQASSTPVVSIGGVDWQRFATPAKTPRLDLNPVALRGVIAYVDVHTTEGADASGIFIELLTQLGARCVKQWNWNPYAGSGELNSSTGSTTDEDQPAGMSKSKIGITHVVYKDGGKRTLEKVREAKGQVQCVGVGWVLDCERDNKWLDETVYAVDLTMLPRGGQRRRKSMEPRALSNINGNLVLASSQGTKQAQMEMSPTKEFLNFDTPVSSMEPGTGAASNGHATSSRRVSFAPTPVPNYSSAIDTDDDDDDDGVQTPIPSHRTYSTSTPRQPPRTPSSATVDNKENHGPSATTPVARSQAPPDTPYTPFTYTFETMSDDDDDDDDDEDNGPQNQADAEDDDVDMAPYYLNTSSLVQQTCPPKKSTRPSFFAPVSKATEPQSESVRQRLLLARRKSLQFAPKVGSPLARGVVYGAW